MLIPLRRRDGTVKAYALVDDSDRELVEGWRWSLTKRGYVRRTVRVDGRQQTVHLHRVITGLERDDPRDVDHENGNRRDCRRSNLRVVTRAGNAQNVTRVRGRSRFRGVSWHVSNRRWQAKLTVGYRQVHVGYFADELEAAIAAEGARRDLMPFALPDPELAFALERVAA